MSTSSPVLDALRADAVTQGKRIVLSEGTDIRVVSAAIAAAREGLAKMSLVGPEAEVSALIEKQNPGVLDIVIHDPATSPLRDALRDLLVELRGHKGMTAETAETAIEDPLVFAALLVKAGHADGTVGGAVATTSDTVRAALQVIGKAPDAALVSSFFLMVPPSDHPSGRNAMIFSDCGLVIDPKPAELASIATQAAGSWTALTKRDAKVALLSFSTKGSARHERVNKVTEALQLLQINTPGLDVDGELQFDTAFTPSVGQVKAPDSAVAGQANVFVFPDLDAGNIGYKIAQRVGGCQAIGPILQGLALPANDLSRGCVAQDIVNMIAVTVAQSAALDAAKGGSR